MEQKEELFNSLDEFVNPESRPAETGILGNYAGVVDVPNRINYVYVRLSSGILVEAFNNLVPSLLNLNVLIGKNPQRPSELKVLDVLLDMHPDGIGTPMISKHGTSHEWPGADTVYIKYRQILPLRTTAVGGLEVSIYSGWYVDSNRKSKYYAGSPTNINLSSYRPTTGARWALLSLDGSGTVSVTVEGSGTSYFGLSIADIPTIPENEIALSAIRCYAGQSSIKDNATSSTDIIDLRFVPQADANTAGSTAVWGGIVGTLSNQLDLQLALEGKTEEAPIDNKQYARKNAGWEEVEATEAQIVDDLTSQIDGSGSIYSLSSMYVVSSVYWNGQRLYETQYTDATGTLVLDFVPDVTDTLVSFGVSEAGLISVANISGVDIAGNNKYYGTDASGTPGFHSLQLAYVLLQEQASGFVDNIGMASGDWRKRPVNTIVQNDDDICSLSSNQITLDAGTYRCYITAPAYVVVNHQARLYNITDSGVTLSGTAERAGDNAQSSSVIAGEFTIAAQKTFELQHRCSTSNNSNGMGAGVSWADTQIWAVLEFWKIS
jgi:hypothetical protein